MLKMIQLLEGVQGKAVLHRRCIIVFFLCNLLLLNATALKMIGANQLSPLAVILTPAELVLFLKQLKRVKESWVEEVLMKAD